MKLLIASVLSLFFLCIVFITSGISGRLEFDNYISSIKVVSNISNKAIPLYAENSETDQILMYLKPGLSLPFAYSGNTGGWNYVFLDKRVVSIRSKNISFGYRVSDQLDVPIWFINGAFWASLTASVISILVFLSAIVVKFVTEGESVKDEVQEEYKLDFEINNTNPGGEIKKEKSPPQKTVDKKIVATGSEHVKTEKPAVDKKLKAENEAKEAQLKKARLAKKLKIEKERKRSEMASVKKEKTAVGSRESERSEVSKREKSRLRHELITMANDESDTRYRGQATIAEMKSSYNRLIERYKKIKAEASAKGFEFSDLKYEDLIKGRGYQICVVSSLIENKKFTILEWCPGRGFESEITVASTINPNLVVQDMRGNVLGIECKYRSDYLLGKEKEICWASVDKAEQYKKFSKARNMPVFIAIGVKGKPKLPKYNFLVPLTEIDEKSRKEHLDDVGFALIVKYKPLGDSFVKAVDYSKHLELKINEV